MKSELDLVEEFCELTEAKIQSWGELPVASEQRFQELKGFYHELLTRRASQKIPANERYEVEEIRDRLKRRDRLRIPAKMSLFFCHHDAYAPARSINVSRGGLFLGSEVQLTPGERLTLYMPNLGRGYEDLFETAVDVVWMARGAPSRGMGVRFVELDIEAREQLDDFVITYLRDRLSKTNAIDCRPGWLRERWVVV